MGSQQYCLRWNNHQSAVLSGFAKLLENETLVDVTIACGGVRLKAHKVVLSACSPYFHEIFEENPCKHPVIILKGFTFSDLKCVIDFMYKGEVNVNQRHLADFLKTAEELQISGLVDVPNEGRIQEGVAAATAGPAQEPAERASSMDTALVPKRVDSREATDPSRGVEARPRGPGVQDTYQAMACEEPHHRVPTNLPPGCGMDSDDGSMQMCPVDAELHIKEEVEILEDDLSVVSDGSNLLLERLTRPPAGHRNSEQSTAAMGAFDLSALSNNDGNHVGTEFLESQPGHSSWNLPPYGRDGETSTKSSKRGKSRRGHAQDVRGGPASAAVDSQDSTTTTTDSKIYQIKHVVAAIRRIKKGNAAPVRCHFCSMIFSTSTNRNRHIKHMHLLKPNERNHVCGVCGRGYRRKDNLTNHLRLCHPRHPVDSEPPLLSACDAGLGVVVEGFCPKVGGGDRTRYLREESPPPRQSPMV